MEMLKPFVAEANRAASEKSLIDAEFLECMRDSRYSHEWIGMALRSRMHNTDLENAAAQDEMLHVGPRTRAETASGGQHEAVTPPASAAPVISDDKQETPLTDSFCANLLCSRDSCKFGVIAGLSRRLERELAALRLLEGMDALEVSALGTFLKGGDIPATIDRARGVLVRRALEAEKALSAKVEPSGMAMLMERDDSRADVLSARGNITHVICFEGEGAEVLLCRGWDDCREQFFNGIFGDGHHDWDYEQVKMWDADFADDDNWTHDEDRRRYCFASDVGEISKVRIYEVSQYVQDKG